MSVASVFIPTCAVHDTILDDRPLDETHPTWAASHYGAHKAAIEEFVYSYGLGEGYPICGLCGLRGLMGSPRPVEDSKWHELVRAVARGERVELGGGKEVHAADVARAVEILLTAAQDIAGQVYNCYDRYVSDYEVAEIVNAKSGSRAEIVGERTVPKHEIVTDKLRRLGMEFGGKVFLRRPSTKCWTSHDKMVSPLFAALRHFQQHARVFACGRPPPREITIARRIGCENAVEARYFKRRRSPLFQTPWKPAISTAMAALHAVGNARLFIGAGFTGPGGTRFLGHDFGHLVRKRGAIYVERTHSRSAVMSGK